MTKTVLTMQDMTELFDQFIIYVNANTNVAAEKYKQTINMNRFCCLVYLQLYAVHKNSAGLHTAVGRPSDWSANLNPSSKT